MGGAECQRGLGPKARGAFSAYNLAPGPFLIQTRREKPRKADHLQIADRLCFAMSDKLLQSLALWPCTRRWLGSVITWGNEEVGGDRNMLRHHFTYQDGDQSLPAQSQASRDA